MHQMVHSLLPIRWLLAVLLVRRTERRLLLVALSISEKVPRICLLEHRLHQRMCGLLASVELWGLLSCLLKRLVQMLLIVRGRMLLTQ